MACPRDAARGRTVLVTGSSRGFGAALAKAFAVGGARTIIHCRKRTDDARSVVAEASRFAASEVVAADLATEGGALELTRAVPPRDLGVLVLNATPPIRAQRVRELLPGDLQSFLSTTIALAHHPLRAYLPEMKPGSIVVLVSSSYAEERPEGFAHYVAAKLAVEGLFDVAAKEHPAIRFVMWRPGPMLTDQTNGVATRERALASPAEIAASLVSGLLTDTASAAQEEL